jgi:restriction system protein
MSLPPYYGFGLDVLAALASQPSGLNKAALYARVAEARSLTAEELAQTIASGQSTLENRIGWICSWMKKVGWVENPRRNLWTITPAGLERLRRGSPVELSEFRHVAGQGPALEASGASTSAEGPNEPMAETPRERIDTALAEIVDDLRSTLLERIGASSPLFFERLVLRLLTKMGYAGKLGRAEHAGQSGDGGIDGILYLDRLELERVYVQAKRWQGSVGASVVRDFAGSMDAEGATKGVILSTSHFTKEARAYVQKSPKAIRLVDGQELARLLVEFEVGVDRAATIVVPKLDEDAFEEG